MVRLPGARTGRRSRPGEELTRRVRPRASPAAPAPVRRVRPSAVQARSGNPRGAGASPRGAGAEPRENNLPRSHPVAPEGFGKGRGGERPARRTTTSPRREGDPHRAPPPPAPPPARTPPPAPARSRAAAGAPRGCPGTCAPRPRTAAPPAPPPAARPPGRTSTVRSPCGEPGGHRDLAPGACRPPRRVTVAGDHVLEAEEARHERGGRALPDLQGRAGLGDAAVPHHHHPVGQRERLALVVRDGEHRGAQPAEQGAQFDHQALAQSAVELAERLVQHQQPGRGRERAGQRDALLLAAGQRGDGPLPGARQPDQVEQLADPARLFAARGARACAARTPRCRRRRAAGRAGGPGTSGRARVGATGTPPGRRRRATPARRRGVGGRRPPAAGSTCRCRWARARTPSRARRPPGRPRRARPAVRTVRVTPSSFSIRTPRSGRSAGVRGRAATPRTPPSESC